MTNIFESAAAKLTAGYLAIIMALSIGCSVALYHVSSVALAQNVRRPINLYNVIFGPNNEAVNQLWQSQLESDRNRLKADLAIFNLAVLAVGGALSYYLARRSLRPIEENYELQQR